MKYLSLFFYMTLALAACQPQSETEQQIPATKLPQTEILVDEGPAISLGQSWTFIDDRDVKTEWRRLPADSAADIIPFKMSYTDENGKVHKAKLDVTLKSSDHVLVVRKNNNGGTCNYDGHIWTETDLDAYDVFNEDPNPDNRPPFYHIVTGTYTCDGMDEPGSWLAKINE